MVQLIIVYCLMSNTASCVERRPALEVSGNPLACLEQAQPVAAEYLREHPAYKLQSWRCEVTSRPERAA